MSSGPPWTVTLRDGTRVELRPLSAADKPRIAASFERLGEESRYRRFFLRMHELPPALLDSLVDVDHVEREAIVALLPETDELLGVARYSRVEPGSELAEIAVTVVDDWQGRGLGLALLRRLTTLARAGGVRRFSASVLAENPEALLLLAKLGPASSEPVDGPVIDLVVELPKSRGPGARLTHALRAAASGAIVPARTLTDRLHVRG